jgi:hypothetical protein
MREFSAVTVPGHPRVGEIDMTLVWHRRHARDPAMDFVRALLIRTSAAAVRTARETVVMSRR